MVRQYSTRSSIRSIVGEVRNLVTNPFKRTFDDFHRHIFVQGKKLFYLPISDDQFSISLMIFLIFESASSFLGMLW